MDILLLMGKKLRVIGCDFYFERLLLALHHADIVRIISVRGELVGS